MIAVGGGHGRVPGNEAHLLDIVREASDERWAERHGEVQSEQWHGMPFMILVEEGWCRGRVEVRGDTAHCRWP